MLGGVGGPSVGHNRHTYAANNPLKYWDPTGRFSTELLATRTATIKQDGCQTWEWSTGATQLDCFGNTILDQITSFVSPGGIYETRSHVDGGGRTFDSIQSDIRALSPNDMSWIVTGTYDLRSASKALEWWQDAIRVDKGESVNALYNAIGIPPGALDGARGVDRRNLYALRQAYNWYGTSYMKHQQIDWLALGHIAGSIVLDRIGLVTTLGKQSGAAVNFMLGAQAIFESMGSAANEYMIGGSDRVSVRALREAFEKIDRGDRRGGLADMVAFEQGPEVLQPYFNKMNKLELVGGILFPPFCPFTTCGLGDNFGEKGAGLAPSYFDYGDRMKWLNGVFLDRYFQMIATAKGRSTMLTWMRTDASVLGGQLADQHRARESAARRRVCSLSC